jgi:hypothetical protein
VTAVLLTGEPTERAARTPVVGIDGDAVRVTFPDRRAAEVAFPAP